MNVRNTIGKRVIPLLMLLILISYVYYGFAQEKNYFQQDFTPAEFKQRRAKIFKTIGNNAIALIQGAPGDFKFEVFRQSNTFYYLCGVESPHAYLLLNGINKKTTLYLSHRDPGRERGEGKTLSVEDAKLVLTLTGVDQVKGIERLSQDLARTGLIKPPGPFVYIPLSPAENGRDSRDQLLAGQAGVSSDPWDGQSSRETRFKWLLNQRFPQFEIFDLSPILDSVRLIKSQKEIEIIREATRIAGLGLIEAMRSTNAGVHEYQLDAVAKYIFYLNGARSEAYASIIAGGSNTLMGHYFRKTDKLKDGDLLLMDFAPEYHYYTSDVTRIWPVNGKFDSEQRKLYHFIVNYRDALFRHIKPGTTSDEVLALAAADMKKYLEDHSFLRPSHLKAVQKALKSRAHFQHPVGMAVHDVGNVHHVPLQPGMVFAIDPMMTIPEEKLYMRIEDIAVVTTDGVENLSAFLPTCIEEIEKTIKEKGLIEFRGPNPALQN